MNAVPKVSAVVLSWDGREETLRCLRSLAAQTRRPDRVTVIDNGSQDGLEPALRREFPAALYRRNEENLGYATGVNRGFQAALADGADFILTPNNDTVLDSECLERLLQAMREHPKAAAISPKVYLEGAPARIYFRGGAFSRFVLRARHHHYAVSDPDPEETAVYPTEFLNACCALFRSESLRRVGLFDETYFAYCEDADLSRRLSQSGWELLVAPAARAVHADALALARHARPGEGRTPPLKWYLVTRNQLWFLRRQGTWWQKVLGGGYWVGSRAAVAAQFLLRGRFEKSRAVARALREGVGPLPAPAIPRDVENNA